MQALIAIKRESIGTRYTETVNARDLHAFLEVGKDFSSWIKGRIQQYDFVENQDFVCSPVLGSEGRGGQNRIDYHLTLDMAKELSMVERNAKGKQARQYFIECERIAAEAFQQMTAAEKLLHHAQMLVEQERRMVALEREQFETKAQVKALVDGEDYWTVVGYANLIGEKVDIERSKRIGRIASKICRDNNWNKTEARHPLFGVIGSYPREALEQAFNEECQLH